MIAASFPLPSSTSPLRKEQHHHRRHSGQNPRVCRRSRRIAEVTLAEAHEDLLPIPDDLGAALLAVAGRPLEAVPLGGEAVVGVLEALVVALDDLGAPAGGAGRGLDPGLLGLDEGGVGGEVEGVAAVAELAARAAGEAPADDGLGGRGQEGQEGGGGQRQEFHDAPVFAVCSSSKHQITQRDLLAFFVLQQHSLKIPLA